VVFTFVMSTYIWGQSIVIYQNLEKTEIINTLTSATDSNKSAVNYFIAALARSIPKKTEYTRFDFKCNKIDRITETEKGNFSATFEITDANCSGDILYKGFSVADVLIPSSCSFNFSVFSEKAIPLYQKTVTNGKLSMGYNLLASFRFSDTSGLNKYTTRVENFAFHYDEYAQVRFDSKIKLIDEYFLSESVIEQCLQKIQSFEFDNTDMIIVYDISLKELEKIADEQYNKDFPGNLNLTEYDPSQFIDRYNRLSETIFNTRKMLDQKLGNLDRLYYEKGLEAVDMDESAKAEMYFNRSVLYNPDFVPSQLELAKLFYYRDSLNDAADKISYILRKLNPGPNIYKKVILYTDSIYNKMLAEGNEYNRIEKYNEAIVILEKCAKFCDSLPGYACGDKHIKSIAAARFGIYQSYLSVAQKAIDKGKPELAEIYISDARDYQKSHSNYIINDAEALLKLNNIMLAYVAKGDTLSSRNSFEKGLSYLNKAKDIAEANTFVLPENFDKIMTKAHSGIYRSMLKNCSRQISAGQVEDAEKILNDAIAYQSGNPNIIRLPKDIDTLQARINSFRYNGFISSGLSAQNSGDHQNALPHFDKAKNMEQDFGFRHHPQLDSLIQISANKVAESQVVIAEKFVAAEQTDSALLFAKRLEKNISHHGLIKDTLLTKKLKLLKSNIFDLRCHQAKIAFAGYQKQAALAVAGQNFIGSDSLYSKAIAVSDSFPECLMDVSLAINEKKTYLLPCNYQIMLVNAHKAYRHNNYKSFFYLYSEAENFFNVMQLNQFGLVHQLLADKISLSGDTSFIRSAIDFMIQKNRPEDALLGLKTLQKTGYDAAPARNKQLQTGAMLARKDHAINPAAQPSVMVLSYIGNDTWFNYFKSSYIKTWKSLSK